MMNKKAIRIRIGNLLDVCQHCPKKPNYNTRTKEAKDAACRGCNVHQELQSLGSILWQGNKSENTHKGEEEVLEPLQLTIPEYVDFKKQGLKDNEIAKKIGLTSQQLANWKYIRKDQIKEALGKSTALKPAPRVEEIAQTVENDWKKKYDDLSNEFAAVVKKAGETESSYKAEINELKEKIASFEHVSSACEDVENELAQLKKEYEQMEQERFEYHRVIEYHKQRISELNDDLYRFERENKAMKELLRLCL